MRRPAVLLLAIIAALSVCGCGSLIALPSFHAAPAPPATPPPVCPGGLSADLEAMPAVPPGAGFPAPSSDAEGAAVNAYGAWLHDLAQWGRRGWGRAADARAYCLGPPQR